MFKYLKNKKGMTLVEVVISLIIMSLIAVSVSQLMVSFTTLYARVNSIAETNTIFDNISNEILNDLREAKSVAINGDEIRIQKQMTTVKYDVHDERVRRNGADVFKKEFYKNKTVGLSFEENTGTVTFTIFLTSDGAEIDRSYVVRPLGMQ